MSPSARPALVPPARLALASLVPLVALVALVSLVSLVSLVALVALVEIDLFQLKNSYILIVCRGARI